MNNPNNPFGGHGPFGGDGPSADDLKNSYKKNKSAINAVLVIVILVIFVVLAVYQVAPDEVAIVTTFGKYTKKEEPGLRWKIPFIQEVQKVRAKRQLKQEFGFRTIASDIKTQYGRTNQTKLESLMLTGDLNVAIVEWIVHYQIDNPEKFLFKTRNGEETLRALSEATMREVVGDYSVTEVLTSGREEILQNAKTKLAKLCDNYETGISIQRVELKDSAPPDPVKPSFNEVNQAEQERDRMQNEALAQYNKEIPKAEGQARQTIEEARGYAVERTNKAKGDVAKFLAIQKEYADAPRVTRTRLYLETMNDVLAQTGKKMVVDESAKGVVPMLFPLGQNGMMKGAAQ